MTLSACLSWPLLWPKSQIRLGAGDTTPKTTPPVVPAPSRPHGKTATTVPDIPMPLDPNMHMAQDQNDDDDDTFANVDRYFADHGYDGDFMGPPSQEPNPTKDVRDLAGTAEKPSCNGRHVRTPIPGHIDPACNTSYRFAASRMVLPRVPPYLARD